MMNANESFVDRYSVVHAAVGVLFQASGVPPDLAIGSHVAFEAGENAIKPLMRSVWPDIRADNWRNHVGDVASFSAGYFSARWARERPYGREALTAFVALGAAIWVWSLLNPERS